MQHRQSGFTGPDESPAHDPGGGMPSDMTSSELGGPFGDTRAFVAGDNLGPNAGTASGARLRAEQGSVDVIEVTLDRQVLVIGRRLTNDIVIHDTNVSRQHARLLRGPAGYSIEDTQSSNGTFVNDERVFGPHLLHTGDVIRIGDAVFVYEAAAPSGESPEMPAPAAAWTRAAPDATLMAPAEIAPAELAEEPPVGTVPAASELSAEELEDELARGAGAASMADADRVATPGDADAGGSSSATGTALADVRRDLASLADMAGRLADRVRQLEAALDVEPGRPSNAGGSPSDDTVALVEFRRLLRDLHTVGDPEAATAAANLLDQLSRQPRDVELLLSISRQAPIMAVVLRQHAYLMRLAPLLDEALGRVLE